MRTEARPQVTVTQYCNQPRWFINLSSVAAGRVHAEHLPDWSGCPGTLYQDWATADEASAVARWWGLEPKVVPHIHC